MTKIYFFSLNVFFLFKAKYVTLKKTNLCQIKDCGVIMIYLDFANIVMMIILQYFVQPGRE